MKKTKTKGFTLIEVLIVITIIGVLAALAANALGSLGGAKSRDAVRIANLQQVSTIVSSVQNRFHVPPMSGKGTKYPTDCQGSDFTMIGKCLKQLKVASDTDLYDLLSDPKQGATVGDGSDTFEYKYAASTDGFKICAYLEDQGAFESLNADNTGKIQKTLDPQDGSAYMHCVVSGKKVDDIAAEAVNIEGIIAGN